MRELMPGPLQGRVKGIGEEGGEAREVTQVGPGRRLGKGSQSTF